MHSTNFKIRKSDKKTVLDKVTLNNEITFRLKLKALCEEHNLNPYMFQPGGYPPPRCMTFPINEIFVPLESIIHTKFLFIKKMLIYKWFGGAKKEIAERRYGRCLAIERKVCRIKVLFRHLNIYIISGFQSKHSTLVVKVHIGIYDHIYAVAQAFCSCQKDESSWTTSCRHVAALLYLLQDYSKTGKIPKKSLHKLPTKLPRKKEVKELV